MQARMRAGHAKITRLSCLLVVCSSAPVPAVSTRHYAAGIHSRGLRQGGSAVAKIMQPYRRQARCGGEFLEGAAEPVRGHRVAVEVSEHVPAGLVAGPERGGVGVLPVTVGAQRRDGGVVQGDS
jgi:hypothetical protein